jgi:hypothetical protein
VNSLPAASPSDTRDGAGRFAPGNPGGPGNPFARKTARLRAELLKAVTKEDLRDVARALVSQAKHGDVPAIRELLDRLFGKPRQSVELEANVHEAPQVHTHTIDYDAIRRRLDALDCATRERTAPAHPRLNGEP